MSSLGMNAHGEVRSASEFKDIFEDTGNSFSPYRCPFCEVAYEDRCIVTVCVKAPHFKLPKGVTHRGDCNGETGADSRDGRSNTAPSAPERKVVGGIELPEALVNRRRATTFGKSSDVGTGQLPGAAEIGRRRSKLAADRTLSSFYTTSQLRAIVHAFKRLKIEAYEKAVASKLVRGSAEYNACFRSTLEAHKLALYDQKLTYGSAFQGSKLRPWSVARVYFGTGAVRVEGNNFVIQDENSWPKIPKNKVDLVPFIVKFSSTVQTGSPTSHERALAELEHLATVGQRVEWYAYGLPVLKVEKYELVVESPDHLYLIDPRQS